MSGAEAGPPPGAAAYRTAYVLCALLIVGSLVFIGWRLVQLRAASGGRAVPREAVSMVLSRSLPVDESHSLRLLDSQAEYVVVFLFTPADCAACLPELGGLNELAKERKDIEVIGVIGFSNPAEARQTRENFALDLPIVQDPDGELLKAINPPRTPWKMVIRRADQRVLFESPPAIEGADREAFLAKLRSLSQGG